MRVMRVTIRVMRVRFRSSLLLATRTQQIFLQQVQQPAALSRRGQRAALDICSHTRELPTLDC